MVKDPKDLVREITDMVGKPEAKRLLVSEGISTSLSEQLVRQVYQSSVKLLVQRAIERAFEAAKRKKVS